MMRANVLAAGGQILPDLTRTVCGKSGSYSTGRPSHKYAANRWSRRSTPGGRFVSLGDRHPPNLGATGLSSLDNEIVSGMWCGAL